MLRHRKCSHAPNETCTLEGDPLESGVRVSGRGAIALGASVCVNVELSFIPLSSTVWPPLLKRGACDLALVLRLSPREHFIVRGFQRVEAW